MPYLQGELVTLAQRVDLSAIFPQDDPGQRAADDLSKDLDRAARTHPVLNKRGRVRSSESIVTSVVSTASTLLLWVFFVVAAAFLYRSSKDSSEVELAKAQGVYKERSFEHDAFDCFGDAEVCCWSFWCGGVQWADTMGGVGIMSFWAGLSVFLLLQFVNLLTGIVLWGLNALIFAHFRQRLRRQLALRNENSDLAEDVAMWCCCQCCAIIQEARQVKAARQLTSAAKKAPQATEAGEPTTAAS